jgi:hypothetical protein
MECGADRLPPLLLAKTLVRVDGIGRRLAQIRLGVANALDDGERIGRAGKARQDAT